MSHAPPVESGETLVGSRQKTGGPWRWEAGSSPTPVLPDQFWIAPDQLLTPPAQRVVRFPQKSTTEVFRVPLPQPNEWVFVKRYRSGQAAWAVKYFMRPSKACRALHCALALQRLGIHTAEPVAAGERRRFGWLRDALLITREVSQSITWEELDRRQPRGPHRVPLLRILGRYFAALHDAGYSNSDPNRNNLLIQFCPELRPKLYLIDLDALVRRRRVTLRRAVKDLRRLLTRGPATTRERLWFLAEYCRARKIVVRPRELLRRLSGFIPMPLAPVRAGALRWIVRYGLLGELSHPVLKDPDAFLPGAALCFKSSPNVTIARIPQPAGGWVLRRLNYGKFLHRLRDGFRPSRARRAFHNGLRLEYAGVATPRVLAAGEIRTLRWPIRAYLLMEEIPGATPLTALIQQGHPQTLPALLRLAVVLAQLHDAGFSHRDLKATNVLFDAQLQPHLIDLDGVRRVRFAARSRAVADLARLARDAAVRPAVPVRYAVLFLKAYCRHRSLADWHWWWRAIQARLQG